MFVTQLKAFFAVARLGSVTQAAKQLSISQPSVTAQIRALEAHYGVELFHRQGGRLRLSDEGIRLLPSVDQLLQHQIKVEFALRARRSAKPCCAVWASASSHGMRRRRTRIWSCGPLLTRCLVLSNTSTACGSARLRA